MIIPRVDATAHDTRWTSRDPRRAGVMEEGGSQTLRLAGEAVLSRGGMEVDNWFCESCTARHCLDGHVDPGKARLSQDFEVELKG